ncbi:MAG: non-ribosomal peptide synthetase [Planctomycetota bacterium]
MDDAKTLPDLLRTERAGSQTIALFVKPGEYRTITIEDLQAGALRRLGDLQRAGVAPGDEVVMPIEETSAFLETFWACQLGGYVAMPLAPPTNEASRSKILDVLSRRSAARLALDDDAAARLDETGDARLDPRRIWPAGEGEPGAPVERAPDDIAFVQYSSGSTRAPKGVIVRHGQALANLGAIRAGASLGPDDRTFSWMPLSHDMGLVGFHLAPLFAGADQVIIPTSAFARTPLVWIQDASSMGATILSSPNFGYRHLLKALDRRGMPDGVDLSRVRLVMNGAEPISLELAREFLDRLAPVGLPRTAMLPVYGLAEATLAVTFPALNEEIDGLRIARDSAGMGESIRVTDDADSFVTVGCGRPLPGLEVRIAGDDGGSVAEDRIGRVWIRGAGVTEGYLDEPEATAGAVQGEGWLDTGDLGFLRDGELYVTGRRKDLVIVDGQNLYPHDLEESLQRALDLDALRIAVAPVQRAGGTEEPAVFIVHRGDPEAFRDTAQAARGHLAETYGVRVDLVVPVPQIPRTTSGKVQRAALALALVRGEHDDALAALGPVEGADEAAAGDDATPGADDASPEALEAMMVAFCDRVLGGNRFGPEDNLFEQGMSSIDLAEIHGLIEARYPKGLDIRDFFDQPTIRGLAAILSERVRNGGTVASS